MRLKLNAKKGKAELEIKSPKVKETLGWLTDDRKMECEGKNEQGKREGNNPTSSHYCRDHRSGPQKKQ
jgi:uncharacterized protein YjbJ (UPF0337 family)